MSGTPTATDPTRTRSGVGIAVRSGRSTGDRLVIVAWIAQTFLQLVLLPVIIVGQNIQAKAADGRADQTYNDAEAVLHEVLPSPPGS